jgi:hypothetical protein
MITAPAKAMRKLPRNNPISGIAMTQTPVPAHAIAMAQA